jgi:hypothetical protein
MRNVSLFFFVIILEVTSLIVFKKITLNFNPTFGKGIAVIETLPNGQTTMNLDFNMTKSLNGKVLVKCDVFKKEFFKFGFITLPGDGKHLFNERKKSKTVAADTAHQPL